MAVQNPDATTDAQTTTDADPLAHLKGHMDDDSPLEALTVMDARTIEKALKSAIEANAEAIKRRRESREYWVNEMDSNPSVDHQVAKKNRRFGKLLARMNEVRD